MQVLENDGNTIVKFKDNNEIIQYCDEKEFRVRSKRFVGEELRNWNEVTQRNDRDWASALYDLEKCKKSLESFELSELKSRKRKRTFNTEDGDLDVERVISGDEKIFETTRREVQNGESEAVVVIDTSSNYKTDTNAIFWKGAAGLVIAERLEEMGYTVELWAASTIRDLYPGHQGILTSATCLKRCEDPLDVSTLVNTLGGWFLRTVSFTLWETLTKRLFQTHAKQGLGIPSMMDHVMLKTLTESEDCIYVSGITTQRGAVEVILTTLQKIKDLQEQV